MECGKEVTNIPPVTRPSYGQANGPDEGSFAWNNPYVNNGSCVPNQIQDEYNLFQTKSYKYVCTDKPPQGMGYTVSRFSQPDCGGILTWAKTFDIKLGTNDSAPSNANDAKPSHAAYTVRSQCLDSGELTTTWTSRNAEMVEIQTYTSTVPNICVENPARAINEDSPIKDSHMFICNSPQKSPPEPQLSEGEIAGIALGCSFAVLLFIGGGKRTPPTQPRSSRLRRTTTNHARRGEGHSRCWRPSSSANDGGAGARGLPAVPPGPYLL